MSEIVLAAGLSGDVSALKLTRESGFELVRHAGSFNGNSDPRWAANSYGLFSFVDKGTPNSPIGEMNIGAAHPLAVYDTLDAAFENFVDAALNSSVEDLLDGKIWLPSGLTSEIVLADLGWSGGDIFSADAIHLKVKTNLQYASAEKYGFDTFVPTSPLQKFLTKTVVIDGTGGTLTRHLPIDPYLREDFEIDGTNTFNIDQETGVLTPSIGIEGSGSIGDDFPQVVGPDPVDYPSVCTNMGGNNTSQDRSTYCQGTTRTTTTAHVAFNWWLNGYSDAGGAVHVTEDWTLSNQNTTAMLIQLAIDSLEDSTTAIAERFLNPNELTYERSQGTWHLEFETTGRNYVKIWVRKVFIPYLDEYKTPGNPIITPLGYALWIDETGFDSGGFNGSADGDTAFTDATQMPAPTTNGYYYVEAYKYSFNSTYIPPDDGSANGAPNFREVATLANYLIIGQKSGMVTHNLYNAFFVDPDNDRFSWQLQADFNKISQPRIITLQWPNSASETFDMYVSEGGEATTYHFNPNEATPDDHALLEVAKFQATGMAGKFLIESLGVVLPEAFKWGVRFCRNNFVSKAVKIERMAAEEARLQAAASLQDARIWEEVGKEIKNFPVSQESIAMIKADYEALGLWSEEQNVLMSIRVYYRKLLDGYKIFDKTTGELLVDMPVLLEEDVLSNPTFRLKLQQLWTLRNGSNINPVP